MSSTPRGEAQLVWPYLSFPRVWLCCQLPSRNVLKV